MDDSYLRCYSIIAAAILFAFGNCSTENKRLFERHPDGMDYDDSSRINVTWGQEVITSTLTQGGHYRAITVTVSAFNAVFVLDLHLNTYLFAVGYVERSFNEDGVVYHEVNHTEGHCYYLGKVRDQPQSTAAVSTCKGIVGYFTIGNISYHIDSASDQLLGPHKVYRSRDDAKTVYRCGNDAVSLGSLLNPEKHSRRLKRFIWPQDLDKKNKVVELYVASDHSQYLAKGSNVNDVIDRTKLIVNIASAGYQPLGIYIVLVGVEVWNTGDKITVNSSDSESTLSQWASYRMAYVNPIHYNDNGVLITNNSFGTVVGLAYNGQMCANRLSAAFVGDVHSSPSFAGSVMDHEMGHNFGLIHDDNVTTPCPCSDPSGQCIMNSSVNSANPSLTWSQCSKENLTLTPFKDGLDICLYNVPQTIQPNNGFCGNGIVENGEQCDCGNSTNQECNKACCDPITCRLVSPATCAYGRCCNVSTCQILSCGTLCRGKADLSCDLDEFCDGLNYLCANDTYLPDGANCTVNGDSAYCYEGRCRSHNSACELIWGSGARASNAICYTYFNVDGKYYGNCGLKWLPNVTFIKCQQNDTMCGRLQCEDNQRPLQYYQANYYLPGRGTIGNYTCRSVIFDYGLATQDPGLVPNGAKCGDRNMCVNQRCLNVSSINTTSCAISCQPSEVCNNLGQCQPTIVSCPQSLIMATPNIRIPTLTLTSERPIKVATAPNAMTTQTSTGLANDITVQVVLGTVLGALALVMTTLLLLFCFHKSYPGAFKACFHLFSSAKPKTARALSELVPMPVFTTEPLTPVQSELRMTPAERVYIPQPETSMPITPQTEYLQPNMPDIVIR